MNAKTGCGQIGRGVAVTPIALLHDQGQGVTALGGEALAEHDLRPITLDEDAGRAQIADEGGQPRIEEALPAQVFVGQQHAEPREDLVHVRARLGDELTPERKALRVACLQLHDPQPRALGESGIAVEMCLGLLIQPVQIGQRMVLAFLPALVEQMLEQHPKLRAPVSDVILQDHVVTGEAQHPRQSVPDDRRPQVPDVHLLGEVRPAIVDHHAHGRRGALHAEPRVIPHLARGLGERRVRQGDVDETGARDLDAPHDVALLPQTLGDGLGDIARLLARRLGQGQRQIGLIIAELGIRRTNEWVGLRIFGAEGTQGGLAQLIFDRGLNITHRASEHERDLAVKRRATLPASL